MIDAPRPALQSFRPGAHVQSNEPLPIEKLAYRVVEAAYALAISRSRLYELIGTGEIKVLKDGGRTLIRRSELDAYLARLEQVSRPDAHGHSRRPNRP
jgi:excisionase family DNA binding protein